MTPVCDHACNNMCSNLCLCPQNLLCLDIAKELGVDIPDPFFTWTAGAALPSLVGCGHAAAPVQSDAAGGEGWEAFQRRTLLGV